MSAPAAPTALTFYSDAEYYGGAEVYLALLASRMERAGFRLDLVLPDVPGSRPLADRFRALGAGVHHAPRPGMEWRSTLPQTTRALRAVRGEILHINLPSTYDAGFSSVAWAARRAGYRRVVTTEHLPMIDRRYKRFPLKLFFSSWVDRVITVAEANRYYLTRRHGVEGDKIRVIPNGVESPRPMEASAREALRAAWGAGAGAPAAAEAGARAALDSGAPTALDSGAPTALDSGARTALDTGAPTGVNGAGETMIGIVGRLTPRKGHRLLLEALARISRERPGLSWRLVIVGEGEDEEALRRLAGELGLARRITWLGQRPDAPGLMAALDVFVLPSTVEAMPLTILEAMAAGVPVVATSIFGVPEIVFEGESGLLVPPGDALALARALTVLLENPELRRRFGEAGRRLHRSRFTVDRMAEETARVYRDDAPARTGRAA